MKKLTTEDFITKANLVHNNKYDYSLTNYIGNKVKLDIICPIHGNFTQSPHHHLSGIGCNICGREKTIISRRLTTEDFITKANLVHNNKYEYSRVEYFNDRTKIKIICPIHGEYTQRPIAHLQGCGCQKCKVDNSGWNYHLWENAASNSRYFDSFKLYVIKCWDENETFYKIGKTFNKIDTRFKGKIKLPYNWSLINIINGSAREVSELEASLKSKNKKHSYTPKKEFRGMYECFSINPI